MPTSTGLLPSFLSQVLLHWDTIYGSVIVSRSSLDCWPAASLTPSEVKTLTLNKSQGYIMLLKSYAFVSTKKKYMGFGHLDSVG